MKPDRILFLLLLIGSQAAAQPLGRPVGLRETFDLALRHSEELAMRGETIVQLEARVSELWSSVKPRLSLVGTETIQDVPPSVSGISSTFSQRSREQAQLTLHQPLFAGLREYLAARAAKVSTRSAELNLERARHLLYQDAVRAYLDLMEVQQEISIRLALASNYDDRVKDLKSREKIGRSRKSEVLAAESQRAQIEAELETARGQEKISQMQMRFLTGLEEDISPREITLPPAEVLPDFLALAARRPDVEAAKQDSETFNYAVDIAKRQRWPVLAMDANYYLKRPPGFQEKIKWDLLFTLQLPLYEGGVIGAQVRQAQALKRASDLALSLAYRRADLEVRSAHRGLESSLSIVKALDNAARLAEANARAQAEDYRLGLVTNLDVLGSLNTLQETQLRLDAARIDAYWHHIRLEVAAGSPGGLQ